MEGVDYTAVSGSTGNGAFVQNTGVSLFQAYVSNTLDNGFHWKLGQFDGVYGYYAGRQNGYAHRLTDTGYIQGAYLPRNHLGWMGGYSFSDMLKASVLVA